MRQTKFLFVAVTQCNNNTEKKSNLFVACNKEIEKKAKNKHPSKFEFHQRYQIALGYLQYIDGKGWEI